MCTVSLLQFGQRTILTSNRDEHKDRKRAQQPQWHTCNGREVFFPKDPQGGGSWIALTRSGHWGVVLNGAFENHRRLLPYRRSRGLILLDILSSDEPFAEWQAIDLDRIEPFTLVLGEKKRYILRWDGVQKHQQELEPQQQYIWASSTLYSSEIQQWRQERFDAFLEEKPAPKPYDIFHFHSTPQGGKENGLVIDRANGLKTVSVTQIILEGENARLEYNDLLQPQSELTL